ncbi:type I-G CRISPR-associated helicase/endonuclease Cas3g [Micrococcus lylae]|uniref:CRISPR-associated helicase Cas3 n=1 Tax=Micrococcus lylae TaxID=1273 RepID=A0A1R4JX08_9MICC|nr:type I-U CRISPR-associated helicase/endonuclease Cas3 [Micrococcus lylae]SJN36518.1 CRISPR-associated helicase Cas3 [Micrococcus lylae]
MTPQQTAITAGLTLPEFGSFFAALNDGNRPFGWQQELAEFVIRNGRWPEAIVAPTGSGKSAVLDVHVFAVAVTHAPDWSGPRVPRRLWHVVGRRALVDDMAERAQHHARALSNALTEGEDGVLGRAARILHSLSPWTETVLGVTTLRGGIAPERGWQDDPLSCQIICATPDMAGSRLLFRGYGSSVGMRPREAGLLAHDSVLVVDEAHLNRQLLTTAQRVSALAAESPLAAHVQALQVVETTATPAALPSDSAAIGVALDDIRAGRIEPELSQRLTRPKPVTLHTDGPWLSGQTGAAATSAAREIMAMVQDAVKAGQTPVGVVVNRVASALAVHDLLQKGAPELRVQLIVGPRRRWEQTTDRSKGAPDVYVATQAIEVGLDLDFAALITDLAPGAALAQRAGRVNRRGLRDMGPVHVLCPPGEKVTEKFALPYRPSDLEASATWLDRRAADPNGIAPTAILADPAPAEAPSRPVFSEIEPSRAALFSRTSERLVVEPDLTLWLRDGLDPDADVTVVGRRLPRVGEGVDDGIDIGESIALLTIAPPQPHEAYPSTITRLAPMLRGRRSPSVMFIRREDGWEAVSPSDGVPQLRPGETIVVPHDWAATMSAVIVPEGTSEVGDVLDPSPEDPALGATHAVGTQGRSVAVTTGRPLAGVADHLRQSLLEVAAALQDEDEALTVRSVRHALQDRGQWETWRLYLGIPEQDSELEARIAVVAGGRSSEAPEQASWVLFSIRHPAVSDDAELSVTSVSQRVFLADHQRDVAGRARESGSRAGLPEGMLQLLELAGLHHDDGKRDPRFQDWLTQGKGSTEPLAKSGQARLPLRQKSFLPSKWRHEQLSAAMLCEAVPGVDPLIVRLVGTSHGLGRGVFPMNSDELLHPSAHDSLRAAATELFDVGQWDAWVERTDAEWGIWGVAWLEALLRSADVSISKEGR